MRKSYKKRPEKLLVPVFLVNERIRVPQVRLIDENSAMVGVVSTQEALRLAQEAELDLVEVSPKADPPVCRIMDFKSFKYQKEKEAKAQKAKQKSVEVKGIRLSLRISEHDTEIRVMQAKKFLDNNDKVKIEITLKGREKQYRNQARENLNNFVKGLGEDINIEQPITQQGDKINVIVVKK
ncbi:MAG: translation initiation factor IF-3 [Patescibacteria group bacterium]|jgi:translation initiation factor IF-3